MFGVRCLMCVDSTLWYNVCWLLLVVMCVLCIVCRFVLVRSLIVVCCLLCCVGGARFDVRRLLIAVCCSGL